MPLAASPPSARTSSAEQRLAALRKANEIRAYRARLKQDLAAGKIEIVDVLSSPPDFVNSERVSVLLLALPGYGPARVTKLMLKTRISESKRLAGLTGRQRAGLMEHFHL